MKIIEINTCEECPYCTEHSGMGFCEPSTRCDKFRIMLRTMDYPYTRFPYKDEIHPECQLKDEKTQLLIRKYQRKMNNQIKHCRDAEGLHAVLDKTLCELLTELGFEQIVKKYDKHPKWYA